MHYNNNAKSTRRLLILSVQRCFHNWIGGKNFIEISQRTVISIVINKNEEQTISKLIEGNEKEYQAGLK